MPGTTAAPPLMRVQRLESALQPRTFTLNRAGNHEGGSGRQFIMLTHGSAEAVMGDAGTGEPGRFALAAPCLLWLSGSGPVRLHASAGTTGYLAEVGNEVIVDAIGDQAEAVHLRYMIDRSFDLALAAQRAARGDIVASLDAMLRELEQPKPGSPMLLAAHLRIILVSMMRIAGVEDVALRSHGARSQLLQQFRQLVEIHFREHWTIAAYAKALGITPDRLHAICTAQLRKTPKALVAERLAREAGLRLERSSLTLDQLSHSLGFRDPAHFSNFFKRTTGLRPGQYRRLMAAPGSDRPTQSPTGFADWP